MNKKSKYATCLWTGGKDSSLAFYEAESSGCRIMNIATFIPYGSEFLAHPLGFMKYQAETLGLPHYTIGIKEPFRRGYEEAILSLKGNYGIDTLVTGDISEVDGYPNWIRECSKYSGVDVLTPLWEHDRLELLRRFLSYNFKAVFSCVKKPWFTDEWLGKELNEKSIEHLEKIKAETGLDICGEQGEYHTLVIDGPIFEKSISIDVYAKKTKESVMYLDIHKASLLPKPDQPHF